MKSGHFLTFEGIDGSGKSTQAELLASYLKSLGREVVLSREPGGTPLGREIRELLLHHSEAVSPRAELLLFQADRSHHVETKLRPAVERGKIVISDRYYHSSLAYQAVGREISVGDSKPVIEFAIHGFEPEIVFLVDTPARVALKRKKGDAFDKIEKEGILFQKKVREAYLSLADDYPNFVVLDGLKSKDEIQKEVRRILLERIEV